LSTSTGLMPAFIVDCSFMFVDAFITVIGTVIQPVKSS